MCRASYEKDRGVIFNWEGGYAGDASASINKYMNYATLFQTGHMNTEQAYYSGLELRIGTKTVKVRAFYAGSPAFKSSFDGWAVHPCKYEDNPVYNPKLGTYPDGFAYYTYGEDQKINSLIYVSPTNVYKSTDEGRTWYDITSETTTP